MKPITVDDELDANLRAVGRRMRNAGGPSEELMLRCLGALQERPAKTWRNLFMEYRRSFIASTLGLAAAAVLAIGVVLPHTGPKVHAELVVQSLARQSQQNPLIDIRIESLVLEELQLSGSFRVGRSGVAGNISLSIEEDELPLEIDAALGFGGTAGEWVLVRKLSLPDTQAQLFLGLLMPPGQETLVILPSESEVADEVRREIHEGLVELRSGELISVFKDIIQSQGDYGVTVKNQADGTVLLTLPLGDDDALEKIAAKLEGLGDFDLGLGKDEKKSVTKRQDRLVERIAKGETAAKHEPKKAAESELADAVLNAVYDPATESVKMVQITGFGDAKGSITLRLLDGDIDPHLLDPKRMMKPGTRTIDLSAFESLIEGLAGKLKE